MTETAAGTPSIASPSCTVYFDGACPVCSREIALYQRLAPAGAVAFVDVSGPADPAPDLGRDAALARFHVRDRDGRLVSGAAAFLALWRAVPRLALAGKILSVPPFPWLLELGYRGFLRVRRLWR